MVIKINRLTQKDINPQTVKSINFLLKLLGGEMKATTLGNNDLKERLAQEDFYVFIACDGPKIVGMATIYFKRPLYKPIGWVEDVIVLPEYRGQGIAARLVRTLISTAGKKKIKVIDLTTGYQRQQAFALYKKMGFKKRKSHLMRLLLK